MELNSLVKNKGLNLRFVDLTYKVNTWTDVFKIGMYIIGQVCREFLTNSITLILVLIFNY